MNNIVPLSFIHLHQQNFIKGWTIYVRLDFYQRKASIRELLLLEEIRYLLSEVNAQAWIMRMRSDTKQCTVIKVLIEYGRR